MIVEMSSVAKYADMLAALGQEARLLVVRRLLRAHPTGMFAGELAEALSIPPSTLSHHLDTLHRHGLVQQSREGKFLRYRADDVGLGRLLSFLLEECCGDKTQVLSASSLVRKKK
jgi:DNA-binding transcriptional ArsR family regulator